MVRTVNIKKKKKLLKQDYKIQNFGKIIKYRWLD